jgi:hypothetical protein
MVHFAPPATKRGANHYLLAYKGLEMNSQDGIKDPDHDLKRPASMPIRSHSSFHKPGGPNTQGNDRECLNQDPEGQQGGTEGGSQGNLFAAKVRRTRATLHLRSGKF